MKILFVTDLYPIIEDETIPKIVEDFALAFHEYGNNVFVIRPNFLLNTFLRKHKYIPECETTKNGVRIYNKNFILPFLNDDISFLNQNFDLIISHMPSGHIYADLINKKLKLPHISIIHQSDFQVLTNFKYAFYFKKRLQNALKNSTLIGARNHFLAKKLNADFVLPSYIDEKFIVKNKIQNKKLKLITLSKLIKRKNIDKVIKALSNVDFDFKYSIYGQGRELNKLEKLIQKHNLSNKIKIHPHINHDFIWEKLDENDVFILPSVNETFGISYLEALARGLIVIGTKNTGIDGFIQNEENGFLIEPTIQEIINILEKINKINKEKIIENSLSNIQNYTKEKIMNKYNEIIKKIL